MGEPGSGDVTGERYNRSEENARDSVVLGDLGRPPVHISHISSVAEMT